MWSWVDIFVGAGELRCGRGTVALLLISGDRSAGGVHASARTSHASEVLALVAVM